MKRKANGMVIGILALVIILGLGGFLATKLLRSAPQSTVAPTPTASRGDIDRSGTVDETDKMMVRSHIGCISTQPCWNTTIGKTKDGDNPIYVFDLDLNKDGAITQADLDLVN